jgi:hypothetical protein
MTNNALKLYHDYHTDRDDERCGLFEVLSKKYNLKTALYPGSFVHVTPSFVFPKVVYVDSHKKASQFFKDKSMYDFVKSRKHYKQEPEIVFHAANYTRNFG